MHYRISLRNVYSFGSLDIDKPDIIVKRNEEKEAEPRKGTFINDKRISNCPRSYRNESFVAR